MTQREENDRLFLDIMKQINNILDGIKQLNGNLRGELDDLTVEIAENIANKRIG
jgi:hypothetical protein